jgi:NAD(P)-dependent dehydrogenase (short-subunit alcohol dehydrogenase family)
MTKQASKLIFLGSTACISKPPMLSSYSVSKAALESLVTSINNEPPSHIRASCARIGTCKTSFSGSLETDNIILEEDIVNFVHYIECSRLLILPDLVSIRPIRYNLPD